MRVVADIAGALIQIHDNNGLPRPHRRHGRLTPRHLLVGVDGSASLFNAREPFSKLLPPQPDLGYLAPELLTQSGPATQQSDVFSLGVLLWEALDNGRLFPHRRAAAISRLIARRSLPGPRIEEEWALPLGEVAMKALSQNPDERYLDGTAFWLALREHLPAPDGARQVLSRLAQRALKLELTTEIRDVPPYLAPRVIGLGASAPPSRSSFDEEQDVEAPARYSLHPQRSNRSPSASHPPLDDEAWGLSDPPSPRVSQLGLSSPTLSLAPGPTATTVRARPSAAPAAPASEEASRAQRTSAVPPRATESQPPARNDAESPISTLHVNLPRELMDASLPFYVSSQPASRPFPWGALSFAALIFFGVGAAVAFGAVSALRAPASAAHIPTPAASVATPTTPAPAAAPAAVAPPAGAAPAVAAEAAVAPAAAAPLEGAAATDAPPELPAGSPAPAASEVQPEVPQQKPPQAATALKPADAAHKPARRAKAARPKRPRLELAPVREEAPALVVPQTAPEIIRDPPGEAAPSAPLEDSPSDSTQAPGAEAKDEPKGEAPADLPFVEQPY